MNPLKRADAGFGLVGVIVALVLLSVGVLSVSTVLSQSLAMQTMGSQYVLTFFGIVSAATFFIPGLKYYRQRKRVS